MSNDVSKHYDTSFYEAHRDGSRRSAAVVVSIVNKLLRPESVLDVGCGVGSWLAEWADEGVTDLLGLDGEYVDKEAMAIEPSRFQTLDLSKPFSLGRTFDLVESLEVAEHLNESCADTFIESVAKHADTVLFSAAIPGQRGSHHVNEQWPSYWTAKFANAGFTPFDVIRPSIWADSRVDIWYRQNILLFSKTREFSSPHQYLDVVHPALWTQRQDASNFPLRQLLTSLPTASTSAIRWFGERAASRIRSR